MVDVGVVSVSGGGVLVGRTGVVRVVGTAVVTDFVVDWLGVVPAKIKRGVYYIKQPTLSLYTTQSCTTNV